jgi:hypothetical protein
VTVTVTVMVMVTMMAMESLFESQDLMWVHPGIVMVMVVVMVLPVC